MEYTVQKGKVFTESPTKQFGIQINEKTFSILTSGIYQNKIQAIIREYSTNALDAQKENGYSGQFEVSLPTHNDLNFIVRDYGIGLSLEDFNEVFTNFFASTKDKTNAYNGTLGLGSKCFASYFTKTCTIESWKDGRHYIFNCFIGNSGLPEATVLLNEEDKKTHSGTKIIIPVNREDITRFRTEAAQVYSFFKEVPKINFSIDLSKGKPVFTSKNGEIVQYNNAMIPEPSAIMSNVRYPITFSEEFREFSKIFDTKSASYSNRNSNCVFLFFENGEINFTPSRETLEYNPRTITAIKNKMRAFLDDYSNFISDLVKTGKTELDAVKKVYDIKQSSPVTTGLTPGYINYNGKKITIANNFSLPTGKVVTHTQNGRVGFSPIVSLFDSKESYNNVFVYYNDLDKNGVARIRERSKTGAKYDKYIIVDDDILSHCPYQYSKDDFPHKASDLDEVVKVPTRKSTLSSIMQIVPRALTLQEAWIPCKLDAVTNKVYVIRSGSSAKTKLLGADLIEIDPRRMVQRYHLLIDGKHIYGIYQREEKKLRDAGFISFSDFLHQEKATLKAAVSLNKDYYEYIYGLGAAEISGLVYADIQALVKAIAGAKQKTKSTQLDKILGHLNVIVKMRATSDPILKDIKTIQQFLSFEDHKLDDKTKIIDDDFKVVYDYHACVRGISAHPDVLNNYFLGIVSR